MFLASTIILAAQTGVFAYSWFVYYGQKEVIRRDYYFWGNVVAIAQYALILLLFYKVFGAFKVGYLRIMDVLLSQVISLLCTNAFIYLEMNLIAMWKFGEHLAPMFTITAVDLLITVVWVFFVRWIYVRIYPPRQMLLIYGDYNPVDLVRKISGREDKYSVKKSMHLSEGLDTIQKEILNYHAVVLADLPSHERNLLLKFCFEKDIRCYSIPKLSDIMLMSSEEIHLFDTTLLLCRNRRLTVEQQAAKRLMDVIVSAAGVVIASPIMLLIAVLIKAYDGGPVFYRQPRLTLDGRVFDVLKFRSMRVDSEKEGARLAMKGDSRVTPVGKVLRNIHFDELPQLFNILKGDMSLVGPRPERPEIAAEYKKEIPEFDYRLKVKAGLTGFAQVYGKYNTTPYDKLKLDLTYIENYSFLLDCKLIFLTFKILFQKENTEGVEQWQVTAATKEKVQHEEQLHKKEKEN